MNELAISLILKFIEIYLFPPAFSWNKQEFKKRSYERWAADEICERIMDHPFDPPLDTIENFIFEMYIFACFSDEDEQRTFIFQTAVEIAEELALLFV